ncbi:3575_t:CDS:1 [Acaulospora colombiana]|uniref:3575_t:CDS:1 n=1 Tax=Acaulospora colombiana TaxID=27376 RepID=A0ACA9KV40_9GLOM|nr:3575_t:CDS:1 [Acaulospora colombiana]
MTHSKFNNNLGPSSAFEQKSRQDDRIGSPPKSPVFQKNLSDLQEIISTVFQSFHGCKITTSDEYLQEKLSKITHEDGIFYIATVQSIQHNDQIKSHAENIINYIQKTRSLATTAGRRPVPKELIRDSMDIKESVRGLRNDYDGVLRRLRIIQEELRKRKCDISKRIDEIPFYESQVYMYRKKSKLHFIRSKNLFLFGGGMIFGALLIVMCALGDANESIIIPINLTMLGLGLLLIMVGLAFKATSYLHIRKSDLIDEEIEYTNKLSETTNDQETRMIELNLIDIIFQLKIILAYWKKCLSNLENLMVELGHGDHILSERIEEVWLNIKDQCEIYNRIIGEILDQVDSVQGRQVTTTSVS